MKSIRITEDDALREGISFAELILKRQASGFVTVKRDYHHAVGVIVTMQPQVTKYTELDLSYAISKALLIANLDHGVKITEQVSQLVWKEAMKMAKVSATSRAFRKEAILSKI